MRKLLRTSGVLASAAAVLVLVGCENVPTEYGNYPRKEYGRPVSDPSQPRETVFGPGGVNFLGGNEDEGAATTGTGGGIGVNSFLWRASLDTLAFMPLASADPFGGVIITDWYSPPETPSERFKMNIYILDTRLRADGLKVAVFRQERGGAAQWADAAVTPETAVQLENAILTRARQLRIDAFAQ